MSNCIATSLKQGLSGGVTCASGTRHSPAAELAMAAMSAGGLAIGSGQIFKQGWGLERILRKMAK